MLQGIRASTLPMPFGHHLALAGSQRMDNYGDVDPWTWPTHQSTSSPQTYSNIFDPSAYSGFVPHAAQGTGNGQPRHHSIATTGQTHTTTPPPPRPQLTGTLVKAQPAFKSTWHGFLDTTKDAMTIVEAALQGRLSHISRRPHDKERADMLTSGTVIVYEENASGIKRWTDAVHWSPSRVMNNCLIYRQLTRALKPEEKRSALNPSGGGKRKRKESASPSITNTGENITSADDEYENSSLDVGIPGDMTPTSESAGKVYANFAQSLTPDQQRRFCGSLIDSYEFKEGGLMKKTISVKYQGTHHHVISYYSLEDVVKGKLNRPFQDSKLSDIQPRAELLTGWKVNLEDEESKDLPMIANYSSHIQPGQIHNGITAVTQDLPLHGLPQAHAPLQLQIPTGYWQNGQASRYNSTHQSPHQYVPHQHTSSPFGLPQTTPQYSSQPAGPQQFSPQQPSSESYIQHESGHRYASQHPSIQQYTSHPSSTQQIPIQQTHVQRYPSQAAVVEDFTTQPQSDQTYSESQVTSVQHFSSPTGAPQYPTTVHAQAPHPSQYSLQQAPLYNLPVQIPHSQTPVQHSTRSPIAASDSQRRASAPVTMQNYGPVSSHTQFPATSQQQTYYAGF